LNLQVVAFLIFPTPTNSFNVESLRGHAVTKGLKDTIDEIQGSILQNSISAETLFGKNFILEILVKFSPQKATDTYTCI
jgi:hypothetical protein